MQENDQRFLVIRLSSIGDIVHTLPAVSELSRSFPRAEIHWLVEKRFASLLAGNPYVRQVIEVDTLGWRKRPLSAASRSALAQTRKILREQRYETVIDFQGLIKTGLLSRATGAPRRVGFARKWLRESTAAVFYTDRVTPRSHRHVIELNLALVEHLGTRPGALEFPLPSSLADDRNIELRLEGLGVRDFILISPGGGWKAKRWPPASYSELIRRLEREFQADVLLTGSPSEEATICEILGGAAGNRARYFPSTLAEFIALARRTRLFIGGDTGPLHIAAAISAPVVAIFDATDRLNTPERNGPSDPAAIVVTNAATVREGRARKRRDYLRGIPVDAVFEGVRERWKKAYG